MVYCLIIPLESAAQLVAFSRYERTHPNFVSAAGIEILDCKLAAPLSFCRGFGPRFCVHWAQNEAKVMFWRVSFCSSLLRFSWNWFSLRWQSTKRNAVPVQTGLSSFDLRRKRTKLSQSTCIQDDLRFRSFRVVSFVVV